MIKMMKLFVAQIALVLSSNLVHSLSILKKPLKINTPALNNSDRQLNKQSTALDVLNYLNKHSCLASYVTTNHTNERKPIAIVTGGSSGIGIPSVEALALAGMKVVLCARNVTAAIEVVQQEIPQSLRSNIRIQKLDLSDFVSIQSACTEILEKDCDTSNSDGGISVVLNNAGVMAPPKRMSTAQGLELQFGTNHVGHHMLTRLLLPSMSNDGRIVTVASTAHAFGQLDFSNLNYNEDGPERSYSAWGAYGQSKLANILFAKGLDDKLKEAGSNIISVSLHPGVIGTNLWRYSPKWTRPILNAIVADKNTQQGAATSVFSCLVEASQLKGGEYLVDCAVAEPNSQGQDLTRNLRKKLWNATENFIKKDGYNLPEDLF